MPKPKSRKPTAPPFAFPLPLFLIGIVTQTKYTNWVHRKANSLFSLDRRRHRIFPTKYHWGDYAAAIHAAACMVGLYDSFTGEALRWDLIGTWTGKKKLQAIGPYGVFDRDFELLPTVDHKDPNAGVLQLEICSWKINCCKSYLRPDEFIALCNQVATFTKNRG
jgi:hypothetical protein